MDVIKEEPGSHEETKYNIDAKSEEQFVPIIFPFLKTESTEESWHRTTIKEEMKDEIISDLDGSCCAKEVSLAVTTVKEDLKDEVTTEEHGVSLDGIEQILIEEDHGSSVTDVGECAVREWDCTRGTDPLLLTETGGVSCKLLLCAGSEKQHSHKVALTNKVTLSHPQDFLEHRMPVAHMHIDLKGKPSEYEGTQSSTQVTQSLTHTGEKPYKCGLCNRSFNEKAKLIRHSRIHTGEKPYKCGVCDKSFFDSSHLAVHSRVHTDEILYKCEICSITFKSSSSLLYHTRNQTDDKPYKCGFCNASFDVREKLIRHSFTHTGEKPNTCEVCNRSFLTSIDLIHHSRTHTEENPYKSELCDKCFTASRTLVTRSRARKPYKFFTCSRAHTDVTRSRAHTDVTRSRAHTDVTRSRAHTDVTRSRAHTDVTRSRAHTDGKPYKCEVCNRSFSKSRALMYHSCTNTSETP